MLNERLRVDIIQTFLDFCIKKIGIQYVYKYFFIGYSELFVNKFNLISVNIRINLNNSFNYYNLEDEYSFETLFIKL
jgi:hypothetical protein